MGMEPLLQDSCFLQAGGPDTGLLVGLCSSQRLEVQKGIHAVLSDIVPLVLIGVILLCIKAF